MNRPTTSGSNLFRRKLCPGSGRMEAGLPEEDSELSRECQVLHDYGAHTEYERAVLKPHQRDLLELADTLTSNVIKTVEQHVFFHAARPAETVEQLGPSTTPTSDDYHEQTFVMKNSTFSGTPDFVRYYTSDPKFDADVALVIDRKFGYNVVERAELNLQLRSYSVMAYDFSGFHPSKVFVSIVQPRAPQSERTTIAEYMPEDIEASRYQITEIIKASEEPDAPLVPGEEQCRYCKAKTICPAFQKAMLVPAVITPDAALSKAAREAYLEQRLAEIDDAQLEKMMLAVKFADFAHDPILDEARKRIQNGALTNFTLGKEMEVREVSDIRRALALLSLAGLEKNSIYDCVTKFSLTELGNQLRKKHSNWSWKQVNDWVNTKLKSVIEIQTRKARVLPK